MLAEIARAGQSPVSATVTLHGTDAVVTPARVGRSLDKVALLRLLSDDVDVVDAPFTAERPAILDPAARSAASTAKLLLAAPVAIDYHGARLGALTPAQLSHALADQARGRIGSRSGSTPSGSRRPSARGSASGSSARTTRSSSSPATASRRAVAARVATSTRRSVVVAVTQAAHGDHVARIELGAARRPT